MDDSLKQAEDIMAGVHDETALGTNHPFGLLAELDFDFDPIAYLESELENFDAETQAQLDTIDVRIPA